MSGRAALRPVLYDEAMDAVRVLDQRRLPAEEAWLDLASADEVAEAIRVLAVRGAPAIGVAAAYGLAVEARRGAGEEALRAAAGRVAPPPAGGPPAEADVAAALRREAARLVGLLPR